MPRLCLFNICSSIQFAWHDEMHEKNVLSHLYIVTAIICCDLVKAEKKILPVVMLSLSSPGACGLISVSFKHKVLYHFCDAAWGGAGKTMSYEILPWSSYWIFSQYLTTSGLLDELSGKRKQTAVLPQNAFEPEKYRFCHFWVMGSLLSLADIHHSLRKDIWWLGICLKQGEIGFQSIHKFYLGR